MTNEYANLAIIGGGIMGSAIAYYTAKAGIDCILIEKKDIASGTSSRCDGNISIVDKDAGFDSKMSLASQELTDKLKGDLNLSFEYRALGSILVCENDDEMEAAEDWVNIQQESGLDLTCLTTPISRQSRPILLMSFAVDLSAQQTRSSILICTAIPSSIVPRTMGSASIITQR